MFKPTSKEETGERNKKMRQQQRSVKIQKHILSFWPTFCLFHLHYLPLHPSTYSHRQVDRPTISYTDKNSHLYMPASTQKTQTYSYSVQFFTRQTAWCAFELICWQCQPILQADTAVRLHSAVSPCRELSSTGQLWGYLKSVLAQVETPCLSAFLAVGCRSRLWDLFIIHGSTSLAVRRCIRDADCSVQVPELYICQSKHNQFACWKASVL